jgi:hypothetical protein
VKIFDIGQYLLFFGLAQFVYLAYDIIELGLPGGHFGFHTLAIILNIHVISPFMMVVGSF